MLPYRVSRNQRPGRSGEHGGPVPSSPCEDSTTAVARGPRLGVDCLVPSVQGSTSQAKAAVTDARAEIAVANAHTQAEATVADAKAEAAVADAHTQDEAAVADARAHGATLL